MIKLICLSTRMPAEERQRDRNENESDTQAEMALGEARIHEELFAGLRIATFEDYLEQHEAIANPIQFIILYLLYEDREMRYKDLSKATEKVGNGLNPQDPSHSPSSASMVTNDPSTNSRYLATSSLNRSSSSSPTRTPSLNNTRRCVLEVTVERQYTAVVTTEEAVVITIH